jgi:integrase
VAILRSHIETFGTAADGRLFVGLRGGELSRVTYARAWDRARAATFTPEVYASVLGRTPYALRHACVSTWLSGGVPPAQVAEWAGHSIDVLLKVYAKCVDGQDAEARRRALAALGTPSKTP